MLSTTLFLLLTSTWYRHCHGEADAFLEDLIVTDEIWSITVTLDDGTTTRLALRQTDGFLVGKNVPVWKATGNPENGSISYTPDYQAMNGVGDFTIWHDYDKKAAAIFFVNGNTLRGFVRNKAFDNFNVQPPYKNLTVQPCKQSKQSQLSNLFNNYRPNGIPPAIVYPELLIVVDEGYVREGTVKALQTLLVHVNAADMLLHDVQLPKIRLNIAHIVIPTNSHTTPWISATGVTVAENAARRVGSHFANDYDITFNDATYDFIISLVSSTMNFESTQTEVPGYSKLGALCTTMRERAAVISAKNSKDYLTLVREIAHLMGADYELDDVCEGKNSIMGLNAESGQQSVTWSQCATGGFFDYFRQSATRCLDNCPYNLQFAEYHDPPRNASCVVHPRSICSELGYETSVSPVECDKPLRCSGPKGNAKGSIKPPNLTVCHWNFATGRPTKICYNNHCMIRWHIDYC